MWDNGEAQVSVIHAVNVEGNLPGATQLEGHVWTVTIPPQTAYGPYTWVGFGFGQYSGIDTSTSGFLDDYDVEFILKAGGKTVKLRVGVDTAYWFNRYTIFSVDPDTGAVGTTPFEPELWGSFREYYDNSYDQFIAPGFSVERFTVNLWTDEICKTWFPNEFTEYLGMLQIGTLEVTVKATHKAGTKDNIVGYMKFVTKPGG